MIIPPSPTGTTGAVGPSFWDEARAAGLAGLPFSMGSTGPIHISDLTPAQQATLASVWAAHDPSRLAAADIRDAQFVQDANRQDIVSRLQNATPAQIANWVNTNVTDLASAKVVMTKILLLVARTINQ